MRHLSGILFCSIALLYSCGRSGEKFEVDGQITEADGQTLYFEAATLNGTNVLDSVRLDEQGRFRFRGPRPSNPEFYRLRIGGQMIHLAVDSTETIHVEARRPVMGTDYTVTGSADCEVIRELSLLQIELQKQIEALYTDRRVMLGERERLADELAERYKADIKARYILKAPASAYAYFALFQSIGGARIFDLSGNVDDLRYAAAVATAWEEHYPGTQRAENLHNIVIQGIKNTRPPTPFSLEGLDESKISMTGIIDINLPDLQGQYLRLSDVRNKVVLLDFTAYSMPGSQQRIMQLRQLYNRYKGQGFEIYQVSVDPDEHYWKTASEHLPWLCVYEDRGEASDYLRLYQVTALPAYFLINRQGDLVARAEQIPDLEKAVKKLCEE